MTTVKIVIKQQGFMTRNLTTSNISPCILMVTIAAYTHPLDFVGLKQTCKTMFSYGLIRMLHLMVRLYN